MSHNCAFACAAWSGKYYYFFYYPYFPNFTLVTAKLLLFITFAAVSGVLFWARNSPWGQIGRLMFRAWLLQGYCRKKKMVP
jgi:hypothetical protein